MSKALCRSKRLGDSAVEFDEPQSSKLSVFQEVMSAQAHVGVMERERTSGEFTEHRSSLFVSLLTL